MNYGKAVAEARRLIKQSEQDQWRLAELTWEQVDAGVSKAQWARDIGTDPRHVRALHIMWERWSGARAPDRPSATEAYLMAREQAETAEEAQQVKVDRRASSEIRRASPEVRLGTFRELARDPIIQQKLAHDPDEADDVVDLVAKSPTLTGRTLVRSEEVRPTPEKPKKTGSLGFVATIGLGNQAKYAVQRLREDCETLVSWARQNRDDEGGVAAVRENIADLREASEMLRRYAAELELAIGEGDEAWLRKVLSGEDVDR